MVTAGGHCAVALDFRAVFSRVYALAGHVQQLAVERLKGCANVLALARELGIHQRLLYKWRDRLEPIDDGEAPPENSKEREVRLQVAQLKRLVADKILEADFFKGALHLAD